MVAHNTVDTCTEWTSLRDAATLMRDADVGCLVVLDDSGDPVGMVTDRDLTVRAVATHTATGSLTVRDVMSSPLVCAAVGDGLDSVLELMRIHGVRRVPLLDLNGRLAGIITLDQLFSGLAEMVDSLTWGAP